MKPPSFAYYAPATLPEALTFASEFGDDGRVIAGGQTLVAAMNMRVVRPAALIDLNGIAELRSSASETLFHRIGATTRHCELIGASASSPASKLFRLAVPHIAHFQIRNRGTIGGSLSHNDPSAELPAVITTLDGILVAQSTRGKRELQAADFFTGLLSTALEPDEILTEIRLPPPSPDCGFGFQEIARRHGDFALAGAAALLSSGAKDGIAAARITLFGVGDGPYRAADAERSLIGSVATEDNFRAAAAMAVKHIDPPNDVHASSAYRKEVAAEMAFRALTQAWRTRVRANP